MTVAVEMRAVGVRLFNMTSEAASPGMDDATRLALRVHALTVLGLADVAEARLPRMETAREREGREFSLRRWARRVLRRRAIAG